MAKKVSTSKHNATKKVAKKAVRKAAKKTVKKATRKADPKATKKAPAKAAKKTAKKTVKKTVKKAAKKVVKKAAKKKPLKSPLTKAQLKKFRTILLEKRRALIGDMNGIEAEAIGSNGGGDLSNMPTHPADIGTDNYEHEFSLGLLESERTLLNEIDEALLRIEDNAYGVCLGTGKPISTARLNARPWSKHCIEYARMLEQGLVRPGQEEDEGFDE